MGRRKAQKNKYVKVVIALIALFYAAMMLYRANYNASHIPLDRDSPAKKASTAQP